MSIGTLSRVCAGLPVRARLKQASWGLRLQSPAQILIEKLHPMKNTIPILVCLISTAFAWRGTADPATEAAKASEVFEKHFTAVGGRAAIEKIESIVVKGKGQEGQSSFDFELSLKRPGLVRLIARTARGIEISQGRDSRARCWRKTPEGVLEMKDKDAGELMNLALAFHLPAQLALSRLMEGTVCEEDRDGERSVLAVGTKNGAGPFPRFLFDKATGVMVRVGEVMIDDYKQVEYVRMPFLVRPGPQALLRVERIVLNEKLGDDLFDRPAGEAAKPLAEGKSIEPGYCTLLSAPGKLEIVRQPRPVDFQRGRYSQLPRYNPDSGGHWQVDVRGADLSQLDLSDRLADLLHADFDSVTRWPEKLPAGFDPQRVMELGKDPGLNVRKLHARGITGKGVAVGVIDQTLLVDHVEYRDRLRLYEEIHSLAGAPAQMHGPAVASIAVGKTVGVASESDLYYIAETHGVFQPGKDFDWDFTWLAKSIHRLLDVNASLPAGRKIRVISISVGWSPNQKGYAEAMAAVERARKENVFVVSTAIEACYQLAFHGLGRDTMADPNDFSSFKPGSWWAAMFWGGQQRFAPGKRLLVPMDARTTASPTGIDHYVHYDSGGWSWSVPWIAGLYALACQIDPAITPERFWAEALHTGKTIRIRKDSLELEFGTIVDPVALMERIEAAKKG